MQKRTSSKGAILAAVGLMLTAATAQAAPPITVDVNGTPINFTGTPPVEIQGAVLVPLRGVFEALGASVNYNPATKTINAQKGAASIVLPLGQTTATVNGQPQTLSQPAQTIGGTTLVPLRFVAQALGAYVQWVPATSTVQIQTVEPHLATLPSAPGTGPVVGLVTGVFTDTNPQTLTVRVNGQNTSVPLTPTAIVLRAAPGQPATQVTLGQLQPGDQVTVQRDGSGAALSVTATYGEVRGTIKSVSGQLPNGDQIITLNDGTTVEVPANVPVRMAGRHMTLSDIMPDEDVVIRTNPANKLGFGIAVVTPNNPNPTPPGQGADTGGGGGQGGPVSITSFTDDIQGPLKLGDTVTATLEGTPGGKASFAIPGVAARVPMTETSPGVYSGSYTVPKNAVVSKASVLGSLSVGGESAPLIQAANQVTIDSAPPKVSGVSPGRSATTESDRPLIYATLSDEGGTGVDTNSVRIKVDGDDVTGQATVTPVFFNLTPTHALSVGAHTVQVTLADRAGNADTTQWQFKVIENHLVQSFTSSTPGGGQSFGAGDTVHFQLKAAPGGQATVNIGGVGDVPLSETAPGVYNGDYAIKSGDSVDNAPVTAQFRGANGGPSVTVPLKSGLSIAAGPPRAPEITSPADSAVETGDTVDVSGKAAPGATVRLTVTYSSKAFGFFPVGGSSDTKDVVADKNGVWTAPGLSLQSNSLLGAAKKTTFTVSAVTVAPNGDLSDPATVSVTRG